MQALDNVLPDNEGFSDEPLLFGLTIGSVRYLLSLPTGGMRADFKYSVQHLQRCLAS